MPARRSSSVKLCLRAAQDILPVFWNTDLCFPFCGNYIVGWMAWERFRCNIDCNKDPDNCVR